MADLPFLALRSIFDYLTIPDKLRVKLTCKKWKFVVEAFNRQESVCIHSRGIPVNHRWCFSNLAVVEEDMIYEEFSLEGGRRFDLRIEFFRNLQRVYLYSVGEKSVLFLEQLDQLSRLKVLMIMDRGLILKKLSSVSIEKLSLNFWRFKGIDLDTPNLSSVALRIRNDEPVTFRFPLKVKHLKCPEFRSNFRQLRNLETLCCKEIAFDFQLKEFPSLAKLEIWPTEEQLSMVRQIQKQRSRSNRGDLQLIVSGFSEELVSLERDPDNGLPILGQSYLEMMEINRSKIVGSFPFRVELPLEVLVEFAERIPKELFELFPRITYLSQRNWDLSLKKCEASESRLIELIRKSSPSNFEIPMNLIKFCLSKNFFEKFGRIQSIKVLLITIDFQDYNIDFLLNLKNLQFTYIKAPTISIDFVCKLVKQTKFFEKFKFKFITEPADTAFFFSIYSRKKFHSDWRTILGYVYHLTCSYDAHGIILYEYCRLLNYELNRLRQNELFERFFVD